MRPCSSAASAHRAVQMLQENGFPEADPLGDISTTQERALGKLVKAKFATDFYILYDFPLDVRPFYTMRHPDGRCARW